MIDDGLFLAFVNNLRSGRFVKGTGYLKQYHREGAVPQHCTLGVLCQTAHDRQVGGVGDFGQPNVTVNFAGELTTTVAVPWRNRQGLEWNGGVSVELLQRVGLADEERRPSDVYKAFQRLATQKTGKAKPGIEGFNDYTDLTLPEMGDLLLQAWETVHGPLVLTPVEEVVGEEALCSSRSS